MRLKDTEQTAKGAQSALTRKVWAHILCADTERAVSGNLASHMSTKKNSEKKSNVSKGAESATVEKAIKTAVDRALKKDNVSNSNALRLDAQNKGIALMTARTYCASSINGELLSKVQSADKTAMHFDNVTHVIKASGNKGVCFTMAKGVSKDSAFALFSDGAIIALGTFGQLTISDAGTMDRFIRDVRNGEHFATGQRIAVLDGKDAGELDGVIVGNKDVATSIYYGVITRHGAQFAVTTKERKENAYNRGIGARTATVAVLSDKETGALLKTAKSK